MKHRPDGKFLANYEDEGSKPKRLAREIKKVEQLPDEGTRLLQVTVSPDLHQALRGKAAAKDVSLKDHVTALLMQEMGMGQSPVQTAPAANKVLTVKIQNTLYKSLKARAITDEVSITELVTSALEKA